MKKLFSTPKRAAASVCALVAILAVLGAGAVFAVNHTAQRGAIGAEAAENFAFADAGVDPASATLKKTKFEHEDGQFVYEVEFYAGGVEYDYLVKADDGSILKREAEGTARNQTIASTAEAAVQPEADQSSQTDAGQLAADQATAGQTAETQQPEAQTSGQFQSAEAAAPAQSAAQAGITLEDAKGKALEDAGFAETDVTFGKAQFDYDDGIAVYEVEFYADGKEYDYEINAETGAVVSRSMETLPTGSGAVQEGASYIGVDQAKANAANHAGISVEDISFTKAKLENDDGRTVYEIEFFLDGTEYEYVIDAYTGEILEAEQDSGR